MHGEADARESGRLEWTLNDDDDDDDKGIRSPRWHEQNKGNILSIRKCRSKGKIAS